MVACLSTATKPAGVALAKPFTPVVELRVRVVPGSEAVNSVGTARLDAGIFGENTLVPSP